MGKALRVDSRELEHENAVGATAGINADGVAVRRVENERGSTTIIPTTPPRTSTSDKKRMMRTFVGPSPVGLCRFHLIFITRLSRTLAYTCSAGIQHVFLQLETHTHTHTHIRTLQPIRVYPHVATRISPQEEFGLSSAVEASAWGRPRQGRNATSTTSSSALPTKTARDKAVRLSTHGMHALVGHMLVKSDVVFPLTNLCTKKNKGSCLMY